MSLSRPIRLGLWFAHHIQSPNDPKKPNVKKKKKKNYIDNTSYLNEMVINKKSKESFGRIYCVILKRLTENIEWILREKM